MEEYRDILGYEGLYQVSNLGNVKSLTRKTLSKNGCRTVNQKVLSVSTDSRGYLKLKLYKDSKSKTHWIHTLVTTTFLNHELSKGLRLVVEHINGDITDNRLDNLKLVIRRENSTTCQLKNKINFTSKYVGVGWDKSMNKWHSRRQIDGKMRNLGYFDSEVDASNAYQTALKNK